MKEQEKLYNILNKTIGEALMLGISNMQNPFEVEDRKSRYVRGVILI
jgi:hypothetical protein